MMTPLSVACYKGHEEVVRFLIEMGADPSFHNEDIAVDRRSYLPLHCAITTEQVDLVRYLTEMVEVNVEETIEVRFGTVYSSIIEC